MSKYEGNYPRLVEQLRDDNVALRAENAKVLAISAELAGEVARLREREKILSKDNIHRSEKIIEFEAEIARLLAALKPFSDMAAQWKPGVMFLPMPDEHSVLVEYIYLRKASEALNDPR